MKLFNRITLALTLVSTLAFPVIPVQNAQAQDKNNAQSASKTTKVIKTAIPILLSDGYQIKSMQYLEKSMVFVLQRGSIAFVCETDHNGISKLCVQIQ